MTLPDGLLAQTAPLATITTDTGDFAPGHRDFARYTTPDWCRAAALTTSAVLRRTLDVQASLDTLRPAKDTIGARGVAAVARACGARFTVASTAVRSQELSALLDLALYAQNDTLAQAVLARVVALAPQPAVVYANYLEAIRASLDEALPPNVAVASEFVARLDALGPAALVARLQAHGHLLAFWQRNVDAERSRQEAERILALGRDLPTTAQRESLRSGPLQQAYAALMAQVFFDTPDSMPGIAHQYQQAMSRAQLAPVSLQQATHWLSPIHTVWEPHQRKPAAPIHADYWFPAAAADTGRPVRGTVNLLVEAPIEAKMVARVRRWLAQYSAQGLVVTVVATTQGAAWLSAKVLDHRASPWTPAEEAQQMRWYVQDYLHLPVTVAVQVTHVQWRPQPDGRKIQTDTALFYKKCSNGRWDSDCMMLVGRDGTVVTAHGEVQGLEGDRISEMAMLLKWAMAQPATAPSPQQAGPTAALPADTLRDDVSYHFMTQKNRP